VIEAGGPDRRELQRDALGRLVGDPGLDSRSRGLVGERLQPRGPLVAQTTTVRSVCRNATSSPSPIAIASRRPLTC
jgi:hypothetical protein